MPPLNEDALDYQRSYYLKNRARILARRELKQQLESTSDEAAQAAIRAKLAATYGAKDQITRRAHITAADKPKRTKKEKSESKDPLDLAPWRHWRLLGGEIYFTSLKGYTAEEIRLITEAAKAAKAKGMETFNPGAPPEKATDPYLHRYSQYAASHSEERLRQRRQQNRARGMKNRTKGDGCAPVLHLQADESWRQVGNLIYFPREKSFALPEVQTILKDMK